MPKVNINYSKTLIYKIECNDTDKNIIYVGSTTNFKKRKYQHKTNCETKNKSYNFFIYQQIRDNGGWNNFTMSIVEEYKDCENRTQQFEREQYWYNIIKPTMNSQKPSITKEEQKTYCKEWINNNKEHYKELKKEYYETNKDKYKEYNKTEKYKEYQKLYRLKNKEKLNEYNILNRFKYK